MNKDTPKALDAVSDDEQLVATIRHCASEVPENVMYGYDVAAVLSHAAERIEALSTSTQQAAKSAAPAAVADDKLQELHDLLYTAQRTTGEAQETAIGAARLVLHKLREVNTMAALVATQAPAAVGLTDGPAGYEIDPKSSVAELAARVGAWETPEGFVSFGSWMALAAFHHHVLVGAAKQWKQMEADRAALSAPMPAGAAVGDDRKGQP